MKTELQNAPATRKDIDEVLNVLSDYIKLSDERFRKSEKQADLYAFQANTRFDKIETKIIDLEKSHDKLLCTIDKFLARIDTYETEQAARDSQFNKLLEWARKVSAKTGIPLENI